MITVLGVMSVVNVPGWAIPILDDVLSLLSATNAAACGSNLNLLEVPPADGPELIDRLWLTIVGCRNEVCCKVGPAPLGS